MSGHEFILLLVLFLVVVFGIIYVTTLNNYFESPNRKKQTKKQY
jgi:hypothetical protein